MTQNSKKDNDLNHKKTISEGEDADHTYDFIDDQYTEETDSLKTDSENKYINKIASKYQGRPEDIYTPEENFNPEENFGSARIKDLSKLIEIADAGLQEKRQFKNQDRNMRGNAETRFTKLIQECFFSAQKNYPDPERVILPSDLDFSKILCFWLKEEPNHLQTFEVLLKKRIELSRFPTELSKVFTSNLKSFSEKTKRNILIKLLGNKSLISHMSLADVKNFVLSMPKKWLEDVDICKLYLSIYKDHYDILYEKVRDSYDLEKFLFVFSWGQVFLDHKKQSVILREYNSMTSQLIHLKSLDSMTIYTFCKTFNYIVSISSLETSQLRNALGYILKLLNMETTYDRLYVRAVIIILNSIMIQKDLTPYKHLIIELLNIFEPLKLRDENVENFALFSIRNLKALLQDDQVISQLIEKCLVKFKLKTYQRVTSSDSNTQNKIADILVGMGYIVEQDETVDIYSVDFFIKPKLVIDYHGVGHYYLNNKEMIYQHQVKVKVLQNLGYHVQIIPYGIWRDLESKVKQENYLKEILYSPFYESGSTRR